MIKSYFFVTQEPPRALWLGSKGRNQQIKKFCTGQQFEVKCNAKTLRLEIMYL